MKLSKQIISRFNSPDTILVLSKYPYQNIAHSYHGVAKYTQQTVGTVARSTKQRFVVLVQQEYDRKPQLLERGRVLVLPVFSASPKMYLQISQALRLFNKAKHLHIHSEFYTSGNMLQMAAALPFYLALRSAGYFLSYFAHNVITNFGFLARHLGRSQTGKTMQALTKLLPWYYRVLGMCLDQIICLDDSMRQRLSPYVAQQKLVVSPLWVYPKNLKGRRYWRARMGFKPNDLVLVCFGFMTRYKGVDWLVNAVRDIAADQLGDAELHLILAGGKAPSQTGKTHYEQFYRSLSQAAVHSKNIRLTGFIPDAELSRYFAVADMAVLPYRGILGASASWGEGIAYGVPFILSKDLGAYLQSGDIQELLAKHAISTDKLVFKRNKRSFVEHLRLLGKVSVRRKIAALAKDLAVQRSPEVRLQEELTTIYTSNPLRNTLEWQYVARLKKLIPVFAQ